MSHVIARFLTASTATEIVHEDRSNQCEDYWCRLRYKPQTRCNDVRSIAARVPVNATTA